jgi:hypothetical protein
VAINLCPKTSRKKEEDEDGGNGGKKGHSSFLFALDHVCKKERERLGKKKTLGVGTNVQTQGDGMLQLCQ